MAMLLGSVLALIFFYSSPFVYGVFRHLPWSTLYKYWKQLLVIGITMTAFFVGLPAQVYSMYKQDIDQHITSFKNQNLWYPIDTNPVVLN